MHFYLSFKFVSEDFQWEFHFKSVFSTFKTSVATVAFFHPLTRTHTLSQAHTHALTRTLSLSAIVMLKSKLRQQMEREFAGVDVSAEDNML